jgi:hypothetical protein
MVRAKMFRSFLVALLSEAVLITVASFGGMRTNASEVLRITALWAAFFAALVAIAVALTNSLFMRARRRRLSTLALSILLAGGFYIFVLTFTGGYIKNIGYPLMLIFLSGSVAAFLDAFWPSKLIAAAVSIVVILTLGFSASSLFWFTKRRHPMRITVVKLVKLTTPELRITWQPESEPDEFEREQLQKLGLQGEAKVSSVYDLGPRQGNPWHTLIVLTQPLAGEVRLGEGNGDVVYIQRDSTWTRFPPDATLSWRKVEMYPIPSNCTAIMVWYRLDQQAGSGGPCWSTSNSP